MSLRLTNTLSGRIEDFAPLSDTVRVYTCGMTVQDRPHMGHMRTFITADVLRRYLEHTGRKVLLAQNFTDIDDRLIIRSQAESTDYRVIAERYTSEYFDVADRLNILRAGVYPRATQHIQEIIDLIERLVARGTAYESRGDVYYAVDKFPDYGKLSHKKLEDLVAGHRVAPGDLKRSPADFALWKAAKPAEPYWYSPWGKGRPGWHIECSAMSMHYLGETFDIHVGGEDLIFPHHENEVAQSEAATGKPFARYWLHNAMLNLAGEKMSKSTKHFFAARDVLEKYSPNAVRLYLLKAHYKSPIEFSYDRLDEAEAAWTRIDNFLKRAQAPAACADDFAPLQAAMDDDLNTPHALGLVFDAVAADNAPRVHSYLSVLGFRTQSSTVSSCDSRAEAERLLAERQQARKSKDFALADRLRAQIEGLGYTLEDTPQGPRLLGRNPSH
jgi:cysteinyl-tRNA synthetase